jgi:hypothetical protein
VLFLLLFVASAVLAGLPLALVHTLLTDMMAGWPPPAAAIVLLLTAGLSASVFWSIQTVVYLHLRYSVDSTDVGEVAIEPGEAAEPAAQASGDEQKLAAAAAPPSATGVQLWVTLQLLVLMLASWWLTAWLFARAGGEKARWLGWGLNEQFVPPAEGLYKLASVIAAFWGVMWVLLPLVVTARRLLRPTPGPEGEPAAPAG